MVDVLTLVNFCIKWDSVVIWQINTHFEQAYQNL